MSIGKPQDKLIVGLDFELKVLKESGMDEVNRAVDELYEYVDMFKVGSQLATAFGAPQVIGAVQQRGGRVMYDHKFVDIPNTVEQTVAVLDWSRPRYFTFYAPNSLEAMQSIASVQGEMTSLGVTVLTSIDEKESREIFGARPTKKVLQFSRNVKKAGCRGVVCSGRELLKLREQEDLQDLFLVTPAVRPLWAPSNDQKRVVTPTDVIRGRGNKMVISRPIIRPPSGIGTRVDAAKRVLDEINDAMAKMPSS